MKWKSNMEDVKRELVETIEEFRIYRVEAKTRDIMTGKLKGKAVVIYDIEDEDDFLETHDTLKQARRRINEWLS